MDGQTDRWTDRHLEGWKNVGMGKQTDGQTDILKDGGMGGQTDVWTNGWVYG
jgi:hypothetical protein